MARLDGQVALVTGASSGVGKAIATRFGREGVSVVVADIRRDPRLDSKTPVLERLADMGADHRFV